MSQHTSHVAVGMNVTSPDGHKIGEVKEMRPTEFVVGRLLQPEVTLSLDAIERVTPDGVVVGLTAQQVDDVFWTHAGEDTSVDLSGVYKQVPGS